MMDFPRRRPDEAHRSYACRSAGRGAVALPFVGASFATSLSDARFSVLAFPNESKRNLAPNLGRHLPRAGDRNSTGDLATSGSNDSLTRSVSRLGTAARKQKTSSKSTNAPCK